MARCERSRDRSHDTWTRSRRTSTRSRSACRCCGKRRARARRFARPTSRWPRCRRSTVRCISIRRCSRFCRGCGAGCGRSTYCTAAFRAPAAIFAFVLAQLAGPAGVRARGRRPAGAAADDALPRRQAGAVARVHRLRRMQRAVDDRSVAGVCQRRGARAKHSRPGRPPVIETTTTTISASDIATRADTCAGPAGSDC